MLWTPAFDAVDTSSAQVFAEAVFGKSPLNKYQTNVKKRIHRPFWGARKHVQNIARMADANPGDVSRENVGLCITF